MIRRVRHLSVNLGRLESGALMLAIGLLVAAPIAAWPRPMAVACAPIIATGLLLPRLKLRSLTRHPGSVRRMLRMSFPVMGLAAALHTTKIVPPSPLIALPFVGLLALSFGITFWVYSDARFLETDFMRSE